MSGTIVARAGHFAATRRHPLNGPMNPIPEDLTGLLESWQKGNPQSQERLLEAVWGELHHLARIYLANERRNHTLQPTALVNEAYLRLAGQKRISWQNRAQFFGVAAQAMRRILVDHSRRQRADKRGGDVLKVELDEARDLPIEPAVDLLELDQALTALAAVDATQSRLIELRFFAGLTIRETATVLAISPATVKREWSLARAWLFRHMTR